ncbi:hypothetical protein PHYC_03930 [Phycisphaerales bacterium]|nr:hypothetical protein PHYC_03930 [Phycisphaerales bacterium]
MARGIRKEVFYPDPPEAEWLMPNDFKPLVGHRFWFKTDPIPFCEDHTECEVVECEPPRRLA